MFSRKMENVRLLTQNPEVEFLSAYSRTSGGEGSPSSGKDAEAAAWTLIAFDAVTPTNVWRIIKIPKPSFQITVSLVSDINPLCAINGCLNVKTSYNGQRIQWTPEI